MRIVHTEASLGWGGQEIRILSEARGFIERGHNVELLAPAEARITREAARFLVPVTPLPIGRKNLRGLVALRRWLREASGPPIDVINAHSSTDSWLAALACASLSHPPALVRTRHISAPVPRNAATRWLYGHASRYVVTTGEALRTTLVEEQRLDPDRVVSIPTGIDLTRFRPASPAERAAARAAAGWEPGQYVLGIVATLRSWKGHRYLVEAAHALSRQWGVDRVRLVIVGDGPQRAALEQQVADLALGPVVRFTGDQADVLPWLHGLDAFALPSTGNEGVPQALLQALACALPVVTTAAGAIAELARDGVTALVVPAHDVPALAAAIARLRADPALAERLGQAGCERVRERFGSEAMLTAMESVFRRAMAAA